MHDIRGKCPNPAVSEKSLATPQKKMGVTNTVGSSISRITHCGVHINAGCEIGVASTKAYTSQVVVLVMIALAMSEDSKSKSATRQAIMHDLTRLPLLIKALLRQDGAIRDLAAELKEKQSLLIFGRGYNFATAMETALKVKEVALMHSEGLNAGEMKHGPLALVDETLPIIVVATRDTMRTKMYSTIQQPLTNHRVHSATDCGVSAHSYD